MNTKNQSANGATPAGATVRPPLFLYGIILFLVLGAGYLLFRNWQLSNQFEQNRKVLTQTVRQNQLTSDRQQLTFGLTTFSWAVRNALLQNKTGEINEYFNTLVQRKGIKEILLVDTAGKVTLSTNKKNQGLPYTGRFPAYLLQQKDVYFSGKVPYEMSIPITAPNQRLGTLVMFYQPQAVLPDVAVTP